MLMCDPRKPLIQVVNIAEPMEITSKYICNKP